MAFCVLQGTVPLGTRKTLHMQPPSPAALPLETHREPQDVFSQKRPLQGRASAGQWLCLEMSRQFGAIATCDLT